MKEISFPSRAVILAAGRGRRLRPYTNHTPKPLLPVDGRPMLDYVLGALAGVGVVDVCLITHYLAQQIEAYVGDGSAWGLRATPRRQPALMGTAQALQTAASFITEPCFVVAADYALPPDYLHPLKAAYEQSHVPLAVSLKWLSSAELSRRSSVRFEPRPASPHIGRVVEIVEKPQPGTAPSAIGASLLYIVPPAIGPYLDEFHLSPRGEYELPAVINRMLGHGFEMVGCLQPPPPEWTKP